MKNFKILIFSICLFSFSTFIKADFNSDSDLSIVIEEKKCKCCEKECGECHDCKKCHHYKEKIAQEKYKTRPLWKKIIIPYGFLVCGISSGIYLVYKIASKCDPENLYKFEKLTKTITNLGFFVFQLMQFNKETKVKITTKTDQI